MRENMYGYLSADIICSDKRTLFQERGSRKTVNLEEQTMTLLSIFSAKWRPLCLLSVKKLPNMRNLENWGSFGWRIFGHVTRLDQSRTSKNIWWTIKWVMPAEGYNIK